MVIQKAIERLNFSSHRSLSELLSQKSLVYKREKLIRILGSNSTELGIYKEKELGLRMDSIRKKQHSGQFACVFLINEAK